MDRNSVIEECAAKLDEMEAKAREEQNDDKETYESLYRALAFHFAARVLRAMKS